MSSRLALFLPFFAYSALAIVCPNGYVAAPDNQSCFSKVATVGTYKEGERRCRGNETFLPMPKSDSLNTFFRNFGGGTSFLGLTCGSNSTDSCFWDSGEPLNYSNFYDGEPNISNGACVVMLSFGSWQSRDCQFDQNNIYCQYIPGKEPPICPIGFDFFRGNCYAVKTVEARADPEEVCRSSGAKLASIHSEGENQYIYNALADGTRAFSYIGLKNSNGSYVWTDGTSYGDYANFGFQDDQIGNCVVMDLSGTVVPLSKWVNSPCLTHDSAVSICKAPGYNPTTVAPNCNGTNPFNGTGTIFSTSYPYPVEGPADCFFIITQEQGKNVSITFRDTVLDGQTTLNFYSALFSKNPIETWTNTIISEPRTFLASTNFLKVEFKYTGSCLPNCSAKMRGDYTSWTTNPPVYTSSKNPPVNTPFPTAIPPTWSPGNFTNPR